MRRYVDSMSTFARRACFATIPATSSTEEVRIYPIINTVHMRKGQVCNEPEIPVVPLGMMTPNLLICTHGFIDSGKGPSMRPFVSSSAIYTATGLKSKPFAFLVFLVILFIFLEVQVLEG